MNAQLSSEYRYESAAPDHTKRYLWPPILRTLLTLREVSSRPQSARILDLGCGNGAFAGELQRQEFTTIGVDPSVSGIQLAKASWPEVQFHVASAYDDIKKDYGQFDFVVSLEVVEHLYAPREFARTIFEALHPQGIAIISTPFHGYWKNLSLAICGKLDSHFSPLWDHGHIKFWSKSSLEKLLTEAGFERVQFQYAGRVYPLSKSMIAIARKPSRQ